MASWPAASSCTFHPSSRALRVDASKNGVKGPSVQCMYVREIEALSGLPEGGGSSYTLMGVGVNLCCVHSANSGSVIPRNVAKPLGDPSGGRARNLLPFAISARTCACAYGGHREISFSPSNGT
jgi:hypothetical protein